MPNRELLSMNKLDEFAAWAKTQGYERETPKGQYEVMRLRRSGDPKPLLFYAKATTLAGNQPAQHATCQDDGLELVKRWLRER